MIHRIRNRIHRVGLQHAWNGLVYSFVSQPNFQIHTAVSLLVIFCMFIFDLTSIERIILIFCIVLGLVVEMVNTAIESVVDLLTQEWHKSAKIAKDVAAGAMLLTAIATAITGIIIFTPHFVPLWEYLVQ